MPDHARGSLIAGWSAGLPDYSPEAVEKQTGVPAAVIKRLAHEITQSGSAAAIVGGAPLAHSNGLFNALAVNALESLVDRAPILGFTPDLAQSAPPMQASLASLKALALWHRMRRRCCCSTTRIRFSPRRRLLRDTRGPRQNSLHRQLRQLHRRNQRPG